MKLTILSPNKKIYQGEVDSVFFPGLNGQFQVGKNHAHLFALLKEGEIIFLRREIKISKGLVEVLGKEIVALVEPAKVFHN